MNVVAIDRGSDERRRAGLGKRGPIEGHSLSIAREADRAVDAVEDGRRRTSLHTDGEQTAGWTLGAAAEAGDPKYWPKDTEMVLSVHVKQILESELVKSQKEFLEQVKRGLLPLNSLFRRERFGDRVLEHEFQGAPEVLGAGDAGEHGDAAVAGAQVLEVVLLALGARPSSILQLILGEGLRLVLIGAVIGLAGAAAGVRYLEAQLFGVRPTDPLTFVLVCVTLLAVGLLACFVPARRAMRVNPAIALRSS